MMVSYPRQPWKMERISVGSVTIYSKLKNGPKSMIAVSSMLLFYDFHREMLQFSDYQYICFICGRVREEVHEEINAGEMVAHISRQHLYNKDSNANDKERTMAIPELILKCRRVNRENLGKIGLNYVYCIFRSEP